jgi:uncharacterized membrane protein YfcA
MVHDIILFFAGLLVGSMNAVAGGGMLMGFPIMLAVGISPLVANATANIVVLPGNISAAYGYRKYLKRVPRQYLFLLIPAVIGSAIGATILRHTSSGSFARLVPGLIFSAVILFAFQPLLYRRLHRHLHGPKRARDSIQPLFIVGLALLPLGIYGGYFGAGFGFIMLAFLGFTKLHEHIHRMNALKNITTICLAGTAIIFLYGAHLIDWRHGLIMGTGSLLGGYYGALLTQKASGHAIRVFVIVIGLATAAYLGLRSY